MNNRSKAGRKPIGDAAMKNRFTLRLSGLEMRAVKITAKEHGFKDISKFMRNVLVTSATVKNTMKQLESR